MGQANIKFLAEGPIFWEQRESTRVVGALISEQVIAQTVAIPLGGLYVVWGEISGSFLTSVVPAFDFGFRISGPDTVQVLHRYTLSQGGVPSGSESFKEIIRLNLNDRFLLRVTTGGDVAAGDWVTSTLAYTYLGSNF